MKYDPRYTRSKGGLFYAVAKDDHNAQPYCVMVYRAGESFTQQVSKWYTHKGWAIRAWNKIIEE